MPKNLPDHWAGLGNTRISTDEAQKSPRALSERNRSSLVENVLILVESPATRILSLFNARKVLTRNVILQQQMHGSSNFKDSFPGNPLSIKDLLPKIHFHK